MPQEDYDIANQLFPSFRSDLNNNLGAIATNNSGATEPTTTFPYMLWADTTSGIMKQRNGANTLWIDLWDLTSGAVDLSSPGSIGDVTPDTVKATTFEGDAGGVAINEFSIDGTLADDSDDAVPTEQAVKTFVEALLVPVGAVLPFAGSVAPSGYLLCDGATLDSVSDTSLAALFAVIGTTHGGTGAADFDLPSMVDRVAIGAGNLYTLGTLGGSLTTGEHTLVIAEIPSHNHSYTHGITAGLQSGPDTNVLSALSGFTTGSIGGDGSHSHGDTVPPFSPVLWIIKK